MDAALLDTDLLSEVLRQRNPIVRKRACQYLRAHGQFAFSAVTRFEIIRGYKERGAAGAFAKFIAFCGHSLIVAVDDAIFDQAADLWAIARQGGHPCDDADLLIAATAILHSRRLVTGNRAHFDWIPNLSLENWREP